MPSLLRGIELADAVAVPTCAVLLAITHPSRWRAPVRSAAVLPMLVVLLVTSAVDVVVLIWPGGSVSAVLRTVGLLIILAALVRWLHGLAEDDVARQDLIQTRAVVDERLQRERLALASARMGTWEWDVESNELRWSPGLESRLGLEPGSLGSTVPEHLRAVDPRDRDDFLLQLAHAAATGDDLTVRHHVLDGHGNAARLQLVGGAAYDSSGRPAWLSGVVMDLDRLGHPEPTEPTDPLTGVAPRWQLVSSLSRLFAGTDPERLAGIVVIDVRNAGGRGRPARRADPARGAALGR